MADVLLKDASGQEDSYEDIDTVTLKTTDGTVTYVSEHLILNQVQADWNQTDDTQPDYIKNKPETFEAEDELPAVTTEHYGKFLGVNEKGVWDIVDAPTGGGGGGTTVVSGLPEVSADDKGSILRVSETGEWAVVDMPVVQSDYTQNDETADDYIQNRPFYEYEDTVFEGEFVDTYDETNGTWSGEMVIEDTSSIDLTIGNTYTYIWDGTEYTSECVNYMGCPVIGNTDALSGGNNGQPIILGRDTTGGFLGLQGWMAMLLSPPTDSTISGVYSCEIIGEIVKTLDSKFISDVSWDKVTDKPFGDAVTGTVVAEESVVVGSYGSGSSYGYNLLSTLKPNLIIMDATYSVIIGDTEYNGTGTDMDGMVAIAVTNSSGTMVALIGVMDGLLGMQTVVSEFPNGSTYDVKVTLTSDVVVKIDSKYIPDMGSGLPESTTDDNGKVLTVGSDGTAAWQTPASGLPEVSSSEDGKVLTVVSGTWTATEQRVPAVTETENNKVLKVVDGVWTASNETVELPSITEEDDGRVLQASGGTWISAEIAKELPTVSSADEGKILRVVGGVWTATELKNGDEVSY